MEEIWKDIPGFEGLYKASNHGKIINSKGELIKFYHRKTDGFYLVNLRDIEGKYKKLYPSHIVAELFLPNPYKMNTIYHKDGDKSNCHLDNLVRGLRSGLPKKAPQKDIKQKDVLRSSAKAVFQISAEGDIVATYGSLGEASQKTGVAANAIADVCKNRKYSAGGFRWAFID